jgi:hypothetical protein
MLQVVATQPTLWNGTHCGDGNFPGRNASRGRPTSRRLAEANFHADLPVEPALSQSTGKMQRTTNPNRVNSREQQTRLPSSALSNTKSGVESFAGKRGQVPKTGTARRVLCIFGTRPRFPGQPQILSVTKRQLFVTARQLLQAISWPEQRVSDLHAGGHPENCPTPG